MPIENAYQPLLPVLTAVLGTLSGWPIERAFHFILALAWCCGPVALFWFVFDWSESLVTGAVAGLLYSLTSPAEWLIPILRLHSDGGWGSLRLFNLIHYAEDPHVVALTLLPLALLFLRRRQLTVAIVACAAVVLTNAFGAIDLAIGGLCIVLALRRGWGTLSATGVVAWLWISPWLPPSLIGQMGRDQWGARGLFHSGPAAWLATVTALAVFGCLWVAAGRLPSSFDRFAVFFAVAICAIPLGFFLFDLTLVPQANRYQLELEMAVAIGIAAALRHIPRRPVLFALLVAAGLCAGIVQTAASRRFARSLIQPVNIAQTIQYKTTEWLNRHLPGQRAMVSGDVEYLYNVISDNPQMAGGHQPTAPNWVQLFSIFAIYTGQNAGDRDAEYSLIWLKAFGNRAVTVPGDKSREAYHPIAHSHKFDGILAELWHDEDDTIFAVPQRSASLAHVIPREAVVAREPIHGLDVEPVLPYIAALENPALPVASMGWQGPSHAQIKANIADKTQVVSVQENYAPGWRAAVGGRQIPVRKDGIGLFTLQPECEGECVIDLWFGVSTEAWLCRMFSLVATFLIVAIAIYSKTSSTIAA